MFSPFKILLDRRQAKAAAEAIFQSMIEARRRGGHFSGVDLPEGEQAPLTLKFLFAAHPEVKVIKFAGRLTLAFDEGLRSGMSEQLYKALVDSRILGNDPDTSR